VIAVVGNMKMLGRGPHESWCNTKRPTTSKIGCDCPASRVSDGLWQPHRDAATEVGAGFNRFLVRLKLDTFTEPTHNTFFVRGQDGWAFGAAVRFQAIAHDLANSNEEYYWSGYHLLALIIERTRIDLTFLEAIEALALAHVHGNLSGEDVAKQLVQLGVWP
jgi:hypothetical protein